MLACFFAGGIARAWETHGVGGTRAEVDIIVQLMSGEGSAYIYFLLLL
jgi:hypothetical protein